MVKIAVFTGARSEYGILRSLMKLLQSHSKVNFELIVSGMHLSPEFGNTIDLIKEDGFNIDLTVENLMSSDSKIGTVKSIALELLGLTEKLSLNPPDIMFVLGDRFETFAASISALHLGITLAHIHGGDKGQALFDDYYRNSITIYSNIHFVATLDSMKNVLMLGANPNFVYLTGSPTQDEIINNKRLSKSEIAEILQLNQSKDWVLAVYHPVKNREDTLNEFSAMVETLSETQKLFGFQIVIIYPNADAGGRSLIKILSEMNKDENWVRVQNLKRQEYISLLSEVKCMVGNSSSGIIEAPILGLPVINIGSRQKERIRGNNVLDVTTKSEMYEALTKVFRDHELVNKLKSNPTSPYGDGKASKRILNTLLTLESVPNIKSSGTYNNSKLLDNLNVIGEVNYNDFPDKGITASEIIKLYSLTK